MFTHTEIDNILQAAVRESLAYLMALPDTPGYALGHFLNTLDSPNRGTAKFLNKEGHRGYVVSM